MSDRLTPVEQQNKVLLTYIGPEEDYDLLVGFESAFIGVTRMLDMSGSMNPWPVYDNNKIVSVFVDRGYDYEAAVAAANGLSDGLVASGRQIVIVRY